MGKRLGLEIRRFVHRYILKDGSFYWHRFYYDIMPAWTCDNSPPYGWYNYAYYFHKPFEYPKHLRYELKYFLQRGRYGFSERDTWNLYSYLLYWLPKSIADLRHMAHGHPQGLTPERWNFILKEIEDGFRAGQHMSECEMETDYEGEKKKFDRGMKLFHRWFFALWD